MQLKIYSAVWKATCEVKNLKKTHAFIKFNLSCFSIDLVDYFRF